MPGKRKTLPLEESKRLRRELTSMKDRILGAHRKRFEHSGNPLAAWDAFIQARWMKKEIPEWVLGYFEGVKKKSGWYSHPAKAADSRVFENRSLMRKWKGRVAPPSRRAIRKAATSSSASTQF